MLLLFVPAWAFVFFLSRLVRYTVCKCKKSIRKDSIERRRKTGYRNEGRGVTGRRTHAAGDVTNETKKGIESESYRGKGERSRQPHVFLLEYPGQTRVARSLGERGAKPEGRLYLVLLALGSQAVKVAGGEFCSGRKEGRKET